MEHSIHNPKIKGLNPTTDMEKSILGWQLVEHWTHNPKNKGLNPAKGT